MGAVLSQACGRQCCWLVNGGKEKTYAPVVRRDVVTGPRALGSCQYNGFTPARPDPEFEAEKELTISYVPLPSSPNV